MESQLNCPSCKQNISSLYYFCPNCGKQLKNKPLSTTILKQILIYLLSFLLPPLGLWPAVKYLKQKDGKSRIIGFVAVVLTIISVTIAIWLYLDFMKMLNQQLNRQFNGNFNLYY